jgi:protein tyrosine phosphatase (PTP) superfamily phosphohydrolase (DUF442 family)
MLYSIRTKVQGLITKPCALLLLMLGAISAPCWAQKSGIEAPNVVPISAQITTSGQPSAAALGRLKEQGYDAVIYLAPPTVSDAIADEKMIVEKQGLQYINIPIQFNQPTQADFSSFVAAMQKLGARRILVHCQINMRASSMVFLYRTIINKEAPEKAYESVIKIWSPSGVWKELITTQLQAHGIRFQPY